MASPRRLGNFNVSSQRNSSNKDDKYGHRNQRSNYDYSEYESHLRNDMNFVVRNFYKEAGCCFGKIPLTLSMYLILMVFILIFISSLCVLLLDGIGKIIYLENLLRVLLNFFAIVFFLRGMCNPSIYSRRSSPRIGCFLM